MNNEPVEMYLPIIPNSLRIAIFIFIFLLIIVLLLLLRKKRRM